MEAYFFKQTALLFAIKLILRSLFTFLICKLHPPVPWLLTIGKTAPFCFQFEYSLSYLDDPNLCPLTGLSRQPWVTERAQLVHQHRPQPALARAACLAPSLAFPPPPQSFFFSNKVWEDAWLQQEGLEILGSTPCSQKVLVGRRRTSDTQGNKDKRFGGWHSWYHMKNDLTLLLEVPGGGGAAKGSEITGKGEGKNRTSSYTIRILKRMEEKWPCCQKCQRELSMFHIEGRKEGKWGRREKWAKK